MRDFGDPAFFGDLYAHEYDEGTNPDPAPAARFLAGLVTGGARVLELATGIGRVALPLAERGIDVEGIEASAAMVAQLRAKPGGEAIPVVVGDMADVPVTGPSAWPTWSSTPCSTCPAQQRQVDCFRNVAKVLAPGGPFVIECFILDLTIFDRGQRVATRGLTEDSVRMEFLRHDPVAQAVTLPAGDPFDPSGIRMRPLRLRYCWPSELDLMAQLAGLRAA